MDKVAAIIAHGHAEIRIPCVLFSTVEAAEAYLTAALGEPDVRSNGDKRWVLDYTVFRGFDKYSIEAGPAARFFTHYYNGCGECRNFTVEEVEFGCPFVPFDLD